MKRTVTPYKRKISLSPVCGFNDEVGGENGGYRYADEMQNFRVERGRLVTGEGVKFLGSEFITPNSAVETVNNHSVVVPYDGIETPVKVDSLDGRIRRDKFRT